MVGKIKKFYEDNTLLGQKFVIDPSVSVSDYLEQCSKNLNTKILVKEFIRYEIGS